MVGNQKRNIDGGKIQKNLRFDEMTEQENGGHSNNKQKEDLTKKLKLMSNKLPRKAGKGLKKKETKHNKQRLESVRVAF